MARMGPADAGQGGGNMASTAGSPQTTTAGGEMGGQPSPPAGGAGGEASESINGGAGAAPDQTGAAGAGGGTSTIDDGLVAFYPFSGDALDASGHGNDCTTTATTLLEPDRHGTAESAYHFDGTATSYLNCGNDASLDVTGPLTLTAWFKPETASLSGLNRALVAKWFPPDQRSYALLIQVEDQSGLGLCDATDGVSLVVDPIGTGAVPGGTVCDDMPVMVDAWQHAAAVFEPGARLALYLNGDLVSENTTNVVALAATSTTDLHIARNNLGYFSGSIDEVRIYSRALDAGEIAALAGQ
jgi:hypothetical protein